MNEQCRAPSFRGSTASDFGEKTEPVEEAAGAPSQAEEDASPKVKCAEILCHSLEQIQDVNPRLGYLVERISIAIALLHKRRLTDEKVAGRGPYFKETEFSPLCRTRSLNAETMSAYEQQMPEQHQRQQGLGGFTRHARDESADYANMLPSYVTVKRQPSRSVSPAVQQCASCKCVAPAALSAACREPNYSVYCSRGSLRQPNEISKEGLGEAIAVPSRKDMSRVLRTETPPQVSGEEKALEDDEVFTQCSAPYCAQHSRRSCPPAKHTPSRASSVALEPQNAPGGLAALMRGLEGPTKTHFVASQAAGEKPSVCQPARAGSTRRLFGEREGEQATRPLILSETLVLSDKCKNTFARENDSYSAAVREALWLIKCATDFIQSGEGPEYVEKQFFRYCSSKDAEAVCHKPEIPEGMQASQGKYVLLRYAIAVVEAEYGDISRAADPRLYLPDLLRMRDIFLRKEEGPRPDIRERRAPRSSQGDAVASEAAKEAHSLPERFPEERMERHLPLTILNFPVASHRPAGHRSSSPSHVNSLAKTEMPRLPSRPELVVRTASSAEIVSPGQEGKSSFKLNDTGAAPAPIRLPSTVVNPAPTPLKLPSITLGSAAARNEIMARKSFDSSGSSRSRSPSIEDISAHSSLSSPLQQRRASTLDRLPHRSMAIAPHPGLLAGRSGSGLLEHSVSLRHEEEKNALGESSSVALEKPPSTSERHGSKMSLAEQMASAATSKSASSTSPVEGLKLSVSSLRRDSATGVFTSQVFEAPSSPTEPSAIALSTSIGLKNVSASRLPRAALPDIPDSVSGSEG
ncbi:hypothetical protein ACSSS7_007418 [Eimeria intestinalis]